MGSCVIRQQKKKSNRKFIDLGKLDFLIVGKDSKISSEQTSNGDKHLFVPILNLESNCLRQKRLKFLSNIKS